MKILAADDEISARNILVRAIHEAAPGAEIRSFGLASEALREVQENGFVPDVAFLDIEMPRISGIEFARQLKQACPNVNIIFVTGFSQYAMDALALRPSGYLMKPATEEKVLTELRCLRNPPARTEAPKRIRMQCFGNFEVFVDNRPVQFLRAKSKEMLAYLVDRRGSGSSSSEIADMLWEDGVYDRSRQKQFSVIRLDLIKSLRQAGIEDILVMTHGEMSVDTSKFDCDYYMALAGDSVAINAYMGEYMMPYSWAEYVTATLSTRFGSD